MGDDREGRSTSSSRIASFASLTRFMQGDVLADRYKIIDFIAEGGMGAVYHAHDELLGEDVALKTVHMDIASDAVVLERFRREIQLARKVTHPHVCRLFDMAVHTQEAGPPLALLTMELLRGKTLSDRLKESGPLPADEALPIAKQICGALAAAHEAGVIHRDFKSSNIILVDGPSPRAVVTDFGIARAAQAEHQLQITMSGDVMGTPAYMSPEQLEGTEATERSDIYSLGVVLFEMVTARRPFVGNTPFVTAVMRLREQAPSPREHVKDLDPRWESVILHCLERDPRERYANARQVASALGPDTTVRPRRRKPVNPKPFLWIGAAVAVGALGAVGLRAAFKDDPAPVTAPNDPAAALAKGQKDAPAAIVPEDAEARRLYEEGVALYWKDECAQAVTVLERSIEIDPTFSLSHNILGQSLWCMGKEEDGFIALHRAVELGAGLPEDVRRRIEADTLWTDGKVEAGMTIYGELFASDPTQIFVGIRLLELQVDLAKWVDATTTMAVLRQGDDGDNARIGLSEMRMLIQQGKYLEAIEVANRTELAARKQGMPQIVVIVQVLKPIVLLPMGELSTALASARAVVEHDTKAGDLDGVAWGHAWIGGALLQMGDLGEARAPILKAVEVARSLGTSRRLAISLRFLGQLEYLEGHATESRAALDEGIAFAEKRYPDELPIIAFQLGVLDEAQGKTDEARKRYDALIEAGVARAMIGWRSLGLDARGRLSLAQGDLEAARKDLEEALAMRTAHALAAKVADTRLGMAELALAEGNWELAESQADDAREEYAREGARDSQAAALALLVRARVAGGRVKEATKAYDDASPVMATTHDIHVRLAVAIAGAKLAAAGGVVDRKSLTKTLTALVADLEAAGYAKAADAKAALALL